MVNAIKVVVTDTNEPMRDWASQDFGVTGIEFAVHQLKHAPENELVEAARDADVVVVNMAPISKSLIDRLERCRLVIRHGVGFDNVDVDTLSRRGIRFANVPDYCIEEMAEQTIGLILALGRKVVAGRKVLERWVTTGEWSVVPVAPMHRMRGATLGIVGCGRIGTRVFHKLEGYGFERMVYSPNAEAVQKRVGIDPTPLDELIRKSDFLTLHAPLNDETRHMIDETALRAMKSTAFLINTARAQLIDHEALVRALRGGWIAGAGLDVYHPEPPRPDDPLLALDNVVLTPHLGWYSEEAEEDRFQKIVEEIRRFVAGHPPLNWVNREAIEAV